jgi:hypothetical protein
VKGVVCVAIYEYAEHETVGAFVKSLDPGLYARFQFVAAIVDGEVRRSSSRANRVRSI